MPSCEELWTAFVVLLVFSMYAGILESWFGRSPYKRDRGDD